jgi:LPXTG-motif cell wall-anchored protein
VRLFTKSVLVLVFIAVMITALSCKGLGNIKKQDIQEATQTIVETQALTTAATGNPALGWIVGLLAGGAVLIYASKRKKKGGETHEKR